MRKGTFNKVVLFSVIVFLVLIAPAELNLPNQSNIRAICTGLAVDLSEKNEDELMLTAQILIPKAGGQYSQSMSLATAEGPSVMEALNNMEFNVGKKIRLEHCFFIIIGEKAAERNIAKTLDYFVRGNNTGINTMLLKAKGLAKDLISVASNTSTNDIDNIQTLLRYNDRHMATKEANLKSFFHDYLSPHKTSFMSCLDTFSSGDSSGGNQSGGGGGSGDSAPKEAQTNNDSGQTASKDQIKNDGSVAVFYEGKLATILTPQERKYFNWLDYQINENLVELYNITDKTFNNATLGYTITSKKMDYELDIKNKTPRIFIDYKLNLRMEMILQEDGTSLPNKTYISEEVTKAFNNKVSEEVTKAMDIQKEYGFDAFNFYKMFNKRMNGEWQKYLQSLDNESDYMKNIEVFVKVEVRSLI